jgi:serine/threonine protein kinase
MQVEEPENVISNPKFQIIREISRGQNSQVYLAWHTELKKQVALKRV